MGAFHRPAANVEGRTHPAVHAERDASYGGANNIHDGIDGANLMKVNLLDRNVVDFGFRFAQKMKRTKGYRAGSGLDSRTRYQVANLA